MKTDLSTANLALYWTTTFFRQLQKMGVKHIVISPGSRSTPLTLAVAANKHFEKHIILDERSASFTALGIGKATNIPAVLVCTSGTALANYYPAVVEARMSGVPIILATADRPPNLRATGANQAIDQLKLFGNYPVFFHEVGEPENDEEDLNRLKLLGKQAFILSREKRGPVHLNFPFRKPLEPQAEFLNEVIHENNEELTPSDTYLGQLPPQTLPDEIKSRLSIAQKPLIIVGPLAPKDDKSSIAELSKKIKAPILSESSLKSSHRIERFDGFIRKNDNIDLLEPDLLIRFGFQPTTKGLEQALLRWQPKYHYHFASTSAWQDATLSGAERILWDGKPFDITQITSTANDQWLDQWREVELNFKQYYNDAVNAEKKLTDGAIYHYLSPQIPDDYFLAVSNSFPARDVHLFNKKLENPLFLNRGASGIDGVASTAIGLNMGLQNPGVLFTGDLAFLHDTNALLNHDKINFPLVVIVINNSGGSIFRMLPVKQHESFFRSYFETPQNVQISALVKSYDIPYQGINSLSQLREFELSTWINQHNGLSVIECHTDADASMRLRKKLWEFKL